MQNDSTREGALASPSFQGENVPYRDRLQSTLRAWCEERVASWGPTLFISLNFKPVVANGMGRSVTLDEATAKLEIKRFGNRLDRAVHGRLVQRFNRRVRRIPFLEYGHDRGWHCHVLVETPVGMTDVRLTRIVRDAWAQSPWSSTFHDRPADGGATGYVMKERSKSKLETWTDTIVIEAAVVDTK